MFCRVMLILIISITHVHLFVRKLDRQKREEIRPTYHDDYVRCQHFICTQDRNYPEKKILEAMRNKESLKSTLGTVLNSTLGITTLANRNGFEFEPKQLCRTTGPTNYVPRVMRNIDQEWKFVINVKGYQQIFTTDTCMSNKTQTYKKENLKTEYFGGNYTCQQNYQELYLLVFEDGIIDFDKFRIPTTCSSSCS